MTVKPTIIVAESIRGAQNCARERNLNINSPAVRVVLSPSDARGLSIEKSQIVHSHGSFKNPAFAEIAEALELAVIRGESRKPVSAVPPVYRAVITDASGEVIAERNLTAKQVRELMG